MDPRVFVLICLAAASRPRQSAVLEVEVDRNDPQNDSYNETDFQRFRDAVNSGSIDQKWNIAKSAVWPSFLKAHPEETWGLFENLAKDNEAAVRIGAALSPAWAMVLETHNAGAWQLFEELAKDKVPNVRGSAALSPAWPMLLETHNAEAWRLFEELAKDKAPNGRNGAAGSPAWPMLLETHNAEAWQLFQKLAKHESWGARYGAAISPAWPMLLETHNAEAWQLFEGLAKDKAKDVRLGAAVSDGWPSLVKSNPWEAWQLFAELMADQDLMTANGRHLGLQNTHLALSPAWKAFDGVPQTVVREHLDGFTPTSLQDTAGLLQKIANNGFTHQVKDLPLVTFFANRLHSSTNETWLGEMAKLEIFASKAALRLFALATKAKKEAQVLLVIVVLLAALCICLSLLWYFYPTIRRWQDEKNLAAEAKQAIRAAEVFDMVVSLTPEPPAHMAIFDNYQRIYANPYILYKYGYLKEALTQAFRISAEALDVGLHEWDFTAVQKNSRNAVQEMASDSYGMARTFIDKNQAADLDVLMQLCDQIQNDCSPYASKIEEADVTAVDKCFSMYEQAFVAKRAYFDPLLQRIGGKTGAETNLCGEKGILRLAEKNCLRPSGGLIWDCVRAMCVGHTVSELIEVMKCLKDEHDAKRLRIVHVNNRFKRPTSDNWQDIAVYVMFTDPRFNDVVAEIQLTHETFVAVRTKFKAHDAYDHIRFAAEALKLRDKVIVRGVPDSVAREDQKKDSTT